MSSSPKYTEEFKIEAVRQVTERGFAVKEVSARLGVSSWSLYQWIKRYGIPAEKRLAQEDQAAKLKRLEAELKRVTEERDILKKRPPRTLPSSPGEVRIHPGPRTAACSAHPVPRAEGPSEWLLRVAAAARITARHGEPAISGPDQAIVAAERRRLRLPQGTCRFA